MIKMQIIGNLGKDCIVNNVNGKNVINFTVAHTERFKDSQGNNQERTTWVDCAWWIDRTAVSQYLIKGKQVYVEGQPEVRSFTRSDGSAGAALTLRVREVQLLGGRGDGEVQQPSPATASQENQQNNNPSTNNANAADDLPF